MTSKTNKATTVTLQTRLNGIHPQAVWGARYLGPLSCNLVNIAEHEFVVPVGCTFLYLDSSSSHNRKAYLAETHHPEALYVTRFVMSKDSRYFASAIKTKTSGKLDINIHIHHLEYRFHESFRPRQLQYTVPEGNGEEGDAPIEVTAICFSHDSQYLAVATDRAYVGILIFDQIKSSLYQTLAVDGIPRSISFHPNDSSKICVTGENNMVRFWRFTNKSAHLAPVIGLKRGNYNYCCHCWIAPFSETSIVIGSSSGFLVPIQNCEQRAPVQQAFGEPNSHKPEENAITQMLIKGDHIIVASPRNQIILYEVRRSALSKGNGLTASLFALACYRLPGIDRIYGLVFANRESITSYALVACTSDSLVSIDIITDYDLSGGNAAKESRAQSRPITDGQDKDNNNNKDNNSNANKDLHDGWIERQITKEIFKFHASPVTNIAFSSRSKSFLTASYHDKTVRLWDFDKPSTFEPCWMSESFRDRPADNPLYIDLHPSGLQVVIATEMDVKEYAISDGQLDLMRRFSVRTPFLGSNNVPVIVSQPVTQAKYSNGGHLIAVVAGKYVQIFHSYSPDFDQVQAGGDTACRVVSLCDHVSPITDLVFLRGDLKVVTTSLDGSVYSWAINGIAREKEFVHKGMAATHIVATKHHSKTCTIVASFESDVFEVNAHLNHNSSSNGTGLGQMMLASSQQNRRKQSNMLVRRASGILDISDDQQSDNNQNKDDDFQRSIGVFSRDKDKDKDARSVTSTSTAGQGGLGNQGGLGKQSPFLAVWTDEISNNPLIVQLDLPVRSLAVGRSGGNDRFDLCVIGFEDGRILISALPLPLILIRSGMALISGPVSAAAAIMLKRRKNSQIAAAANASNNANADPSNTKGPVKIGFGAHFTGSTADDVSIQNQSHSSHSHNHSHNSRHTKSAQPTHVADSAVTDTPQDNDEGDRFDFSDQAGPTDALTTTTNNGGSGANASANASGAQTIKRYRLEESKCRWLRLFAGCISSVSFSVTGDWLLIGGDEGTLMMLATYRNLTDDSLAGRSLFSTSTNSNNNTNASSGTSVHDTNNNTGSSNNHISSSSDDLAPLQFFLMERGRVSALKTRMQDLEIALDQSRRDNELHIAKMLEAKEKAFVDMETRLRREVSKRDDAILTSRKEYLSMKKKLAEEVAALQHSAAESLSVMEMNYEKKIAQDALYMDRLKQAYDEYVLHMKLDMSDLNAQTAAKVSVIEHERQEALREAEKQKRAVLAYYEYIQQRNDEVLDSLEEAQTEERLAMKKQLDETQDKLASMQASSMSSEVHHGRVIAKFEVDKKHMEIEILRVNNDIDWANDRIAKLEEALGNATNELKIRTELVERAEVKSSEATKKADDLEKIRRTLMVQLEALQRDISPKDKELAKTTDKMQELAREYEVALSAIADKEKALEHKTQNLLLLQKQVRELRQSAAQKESALTRAATLLQEFLFSMQEARFLPRKSVAAQQRENFLEQKAAANSFHNKNNNTAGTNNTGNSNSNGNGSNQRKQSMVANDLEKSFAAANNDSNNNANGNNNNNTTNKKKEALSASDPHYIVSSLHLEPHADLKLRSLHDVLKHFLSDTGKDAEILDEVEAVRREQDRHVVLLHRNIQSLQSSLESAQALAATKIHHHLSDNETLLKEVNALRCEVKALSLENQRLQATLDFRSTSAAATPRSGNETNTGYNHLDTNNNNNNKGRLTSANQKQKPLNNNYMNSNNVSRSRTPLLLNMLSDSLSQQLPLTPLMPPPLAQTHGLESQSALSLPRLTAPSLLYQSNMNNNHNHNNNTNMNTNAAMNHTNNNSSVLQPRSVSPASQMMATNMHPQHPSVTASRSSLGIIEMPSSHNNNNNSSSSQMKAKSLLSRSGAMSVGSDASFAPVSRQDSAASSHLDLVGSSLSAEDKISAIMQMNLTELRGQAITTNNMNNNMNNNNNNNMNNSSKNNKGNNGNKKMKKSATTSYM